MACFWALNRNRFCKGLELKLGACPDLGFRAKALSCIPCNQPTVSRGREDRGDAVWHGTAVCQGLCQIPTDVQAFKTDLSCLLSARQVFLVCFLESRIVQVCTVNSVRTSPAN